jgi:DNA invertase Pin-like site-specific DNA recombinase
MLVGYARTSTADQVAGFESQFAELQRATCEKIFSEQVSAVARERPELEAALEFVRAGDVLVVTKLDRLARSVTHFGQLSEYLTKKGVALRILAMNLDTSTPTGQLMLNVLSSVAQFERELLLERQRDGIRKAKQAGKYKGRKPTARMRKEEVLEARAKGVKPTAISDRLGISLASVYRILSGSSRMRISDSETIP